MLLSLPERATRLARRDLHLDILALLAFPLALLLINSSWLVLAPSDWIDPYVYTGYMLHLRQHIQDFGPTYYGSRLPWILYGYAAHSIFSFELANLFLRLTLFYGGTFSLYAIIRCIWHQRLAATVSALLLGANSYFLWAISWDYVDGAGIVVLLGTLACLTLAKRTRHGHFFLFIAGFLGATAVSIQIFLFALVPSLCIWYIVINRSWSAKVLIEDAVSLALGVLAAFALYGLASWYAGGQFNYLEPQIDAAKTLPQNPYKAHNYVWLNNAGYLTFPAIALVVSVGTFTVLVIRWRILGSLTSILASNVAAVVATLPLIFAATSFTYFQFHGGAELQYQFYADYLLPFTFLALGGALALSFDGFPEGWITVLGAGLIVVLLVPFLSNDLLPLARFPDAKMTDGYLFGALGGAALIVTAMLFRNAPLAALAIVVLSLVNVGTSDARLLYFSNINVLRARAYMIPEAGEFLHSSGGDRQIRYWYNSTEPLGGVFRGVASLDLWLYRLVSEDFPGRAIPGTADQSPLRPGQTIAILSGRSDSFEAGQQAARQTGVTLELVDRSTISRGKESFNVVVARVLPTDLEPALRLSLTGFQAGELSSAAIANGSVSIETPRKPWYYAAVLPLPLPAAEIASVPAYIRVRGEVKGGTVGFGLIHRGQEDLLDRVPVAETGSADVFLKVEHLEDAAFLLVQTWDTSKGGRVNIREVTVYLSRPDGRVQ